MSEVSPLTRAESLLGVTAEQALEMYRVMWRIRLFEQQILDLYKQGLVRGTAHLYIGEEAVAVGACAALRPTDYVTSTHRGHGHALAKGLDSGRMLAEIIGRATGYCKGKGGSMHVASFEHGMLGADAIVGGNAPIAVGAALGARALGQDAVAVCFFGDGAANQGVLFEALNLASVLHLPVIFLCENNLWALSTPTSVALSVQDVATRGPAFGMPGQVVDGQDALAVYSAVKAAAERGRAGQGPTLLECKTYRFHTHSAFATGENRAPEEIARWTARDPIALLGERIEKVKVAKATELAAIQADEEKAIQNAVSYAKESPPAALSDALSDVWVIETAARA